MALYFYFNETTGDLVYSDKATYDTGGYASLGEQTNMNPNSSSNWVFNSKRSSIETVSKDESTVGKIAGLTNMSYMFNNCNRLTRLDLSGFDTSAVTDMNHMFYLCNLIASLDLSNFDTSAVTDMSYMFYNCISLASLDLSNFDTSAVTDMSYMFNNCNSLASLDLSNFDTSAVADMRGMFLNCGQLTSLDLSGFDTSAVTNMSYMFKNCGSLRSLDLSNFDTSAVTSMSDMFYRCIIRLITISGTMSEVLSELPDAQYYPSTGGDPVAAGSLYIGTWVRDETDLTKVTSIVQQAQMSQAISRRIGKLGRDLRAAIDTAMPAVDIVRVTKHSTSYTKDTLEIVTDSTGKVTQMYFVSA